MFFRDVIGQEELKVDLRNMVSGSRLAHALLFSGKAGTGNLGLALALSSYILCENRSPSDSCGQCAQCKRSHQFLHPDVHFSFPVVGIENKKRKETFSNDFLKPWRSMLSQSAYFTESAWFQHIGAKNKKGDINAKECLEIIKALSLKSFSLDKKILILWLPEYLGKNGNKLLKLIEEPPDDTYIFLVSNRTERILNTILSRCQHISVPGIADKPLLSWGAEHYQISGESLQKTVFQADGDLIEMRNSLDGNMEQNFANSFLHWFKICFKSDAEQILEWVEEFDRHHPDWQMQFFKFGLSFLRELLSAMIMGLEESRLTERQRLFANQLLQVLDGEKIDGIRMKLEEGIMAIERNVNAKILMMAYSLFVSKLLREKKKQEILH